MTPRRADAPRVGLAAEDRRPGGIARSLPIVAVMAAAGGFESVHADRDTSSIELWLTRVAVSIGIFVAVLVVLFALTWLTGRRHQSS